MRLHQSEEWKPRETARLLILDSFARTVQPLLPSTKASALVLAIGFGLSAAVPAIAVGMAANSNSHQKTQLVSQKPKSVEINLVSYAVTKKAHDKILLKFVEKWKRENGGQQVTFNRSYAGSGTQTRAVLDGLEADVVSLALALNTKKLEKGGLIKPGWEKEAPYGGL